VRGQTGRGEGGGGFAGGVLGGIVGDARGFGGLGCCGSGS